MGLIPRHGTYLGCGFDSWSAHTQEATDGYFSHMDVSLSLIIKHICVYKNSFFETRKEGSNRRGKGWEGDAHKSWENPVEIGHWKVAWPLREGRRGSGLHAQQSRVLTRAQALLNPLQGKDGGGALRAADLWLVLMKGRGDPCPVNTCTYILKSV